MFQVTCPECSGMTPDCARCEGSGDAWIFRCPRMAAGECGVRLLRAYRDYERGYLPTPGGTLDQAACFMAAIGIIDGERGSIEAKRAAQQKALARVKS